MQNLILIEGTRYKVTHPDDYWVGEVTFTGRQMFGGGYNVKDVIIMKGNTRVRKYFEENPVTTLGSLGDWFWEEVNIDLENK